MEKMSDNFRDFDMQQAMKLANSDAAKQLFALLRSSNGDALQYAMAQAAAGNMDAARQMLQDLMQNEESKALIQQLQGEANG